MHAAITSLFFIVVAAPTATPDMPTSSASDAEHALIRPGEPPEGGGEEIAPEPESFHAEGTHTCQSPSSIGHTCKVWGFGYDDCIHARIALSQDDCCPHSAYGGNSIGFTLDYCNLL